MKHRVVVNVSNSKGQKRKVLEAAEMSLPKRIVRFLFGDFTQIYLLKPGDQIESVDIKEIKEGGEDVKNKATHGNQGICGESYY
ncbi:hypothetical protein HIF96_08520 [Helcococcus kunzii]|uniref:hypothetical protein n=1 Tax=Helcococcus kunzii TaxID=40091 RepID=UPI001C93848D|nr:hypothetical protein [Helcococcus kunzii]QZO76319.1 hypothetical protein HIF96_08520 [Helcococcus kunzii]